jgi:N-acetylmuramoyl-L-alanine amidase
LFLIRLSFSREHAALISVTEVNKPQKSKLIKKITIRKPIAALVIAAILLTVGYISNKTERKLISTESY